MLTPPHSKALRRAGFSSNYTVENSQVDGLHLYLLPEKEEEEETEEQPLNNLVFSPLPPSCSHETEEVLAPPRKKAKASHTAEVGSIIM